VFVKDRGDGGLDADGFGGKGEAEACFEVVENGLDWPGLFEEGRGEGFEEGGVRVSVG